MFLHLRGVARVEVEEAVLEDDKEEAWSQLLAVLDGKKKVSDEERTVGEELRSWLEAGMQGDMAWMETHAAPMRGEAGEVLYHLAVTNDVSERVLISVRNARLITQLCWEAAWRTS